MHYLLVKQNRFLNEEGTRYGVGANYPNRLRITVGSVVVISGSEKGQPVLRGYGIVSRIEPHDYGERRSGKRVNGFDFWFKDGSYQKFRPPKPMTARIWHMIKSRPSYANQQAIRVINKKIFEEILGHTWNTPVQKVVPESKFKKAILEGDNSYVRKVLTSETVAETTRRNGQAAIRKLTLKAYGNQCAMCDVREKSLLVASHIIPWSDDKTNRGILSNVICLCSLHDRLFEKYFVGVRKDYRILFSRKFRTIIRNSEALESFGKTTLSKLRLPRGNRPKLEFLEKHYMKCKM